MEKWHVVYSELAQLLHKYCLQQTALAGPSLYQQCINDQKFMSANEWLYKSLRSTDVLSIDPIHIFASINEERLDVDKRIVRINEWFRVLIGNKKFDGIDFSGCPLPETRHLLLPRSSPIQLEIWEVFREIVEKKQSVLSKDLLDKVKRWHGVEFNLFTVFLFWVVSECFLPLNRDTVKLLISTGVLKGQPKNTLEEYKKLLPVPNSHWYREIALLADKYRYNSRGIKEDKNKIVAFFKMSPPTSQGPDFVDFRLVAIKLLDGTPPSYKKILSLNRYYVFYNAFDFSSPNGIIKFLPGKEAHIYSSEYLDVNISAVVGKNGSGKSTITEVIYMALNNIAYKFSKSKEEIIPIKDLHLELYYKTEKLYKVHIKGGNVDVYEFEKKGDEYIDPVKLSAGKFKLEHFLYTIAINYSHYALNTRYMGEWIGQLFHRDDRYQVPITIKPFRENGNIEINKEQDLAVSRVVANILEPFAEHDNFNLRKITENGRVAQKIRLSLNDHKIKEIKQDKKTWTKTGFEFIKNELVRHYEINRTKIPGRLLNIGFECIYYEFLKIFETYPEYRKYHKARLDRLSPRKLKHLFKQVEDDTSHVAFHFKQAINFFRYEKLYRMKVDEYIDVVEVSDNIEYIKRNYDPDLQRKTIEFIPPSYFAIDIQLSDGSNFKDLSSGEKQRIYTTSSLVYHLTNLNSTLASNTRIKYNYVNIIFDEVELYFHPDMQRTFLSYLLNYMNRIRFDNIYGFNFCFITHSPFILSDIPSGNILFLEANNNTDIKPEKLKTFGANIHELLMNGFFMSQTIGEFALSKINWVLDFHKEVSETSPGPELNKLKHKYQEIREKFYFIKNSLGEEYIANVLKNHLEAIEQKLEDTTFIDMQIKNLEKELTILKSKKHVEG